MAMSTPLFREMGLLTVLTAISFVYLVQDTNDEVQLQLNGMTYMNNSIVNVTDIESGALLCIANSIHDQPIMIEWYFPNGTVVGENDAADFYKAIPDQSKEIQNQSMHNMLSLHRGKNATMLTGIFHCMISYNRANQSLYVGIYLPGTGGNLSIVSFVYSNMSKSFNCISSGGPATNVSWMRNGEPLALRTEQSQILVDSVNATYHNILYFGKLAGNFTCMVTNNRSTAISSLCHGPELTSSGQIEEFSGNIESIPVAGHNYSLTCKVVSDCHCPMTTQWTKKGNPQFMRNTTFVSFTPLSLSDAGRYTCRVSLGCVRNMLIAQKDINIKIPSPIVYFSTDPVRTATGNITLNCTAMSTEVDVPINMTLQLTGPLGIIKTEYIYNTRYKERVNGSVVVNTSISGDYNCSAWLTSSSAYLNSSERQSETRTITIDAPLSTPTDSDARTAPTINKNTTEATNKAVDLNDAGHSVIIPVIASSTLASVLVLLVCGCFIVAVIVAFQRRHQKPKVKQLNISKPTLCKSQPQCTEPLQVHGDQSEILKVMDTFDEACSDIDIITDNTERVKPIPLESFVQHVDHMHENFDELFEEEFKSLCTTPQSSYGVSDMSCNQEKNRFVNIFPYNYNRVKLKSIPTMEGSDYINASFLNGYSRQKAYVAAQGPLPNTLEDFWRMIWEHKLNTVVMLTKCFEETVKCECYWPKNKEEIFSPGSSFTVNLKLSIPFSEFIIRKLSVECDSEPDAPPLEVTQFHYTAWPDHGVPSNTSSMLNIIKRIRKHHPYVDASPLLVHCSAGVGRTGTFIILDIMLERIKTEKSFNIYEVLQQLRKGRVFMVQSLAQYMFVHDVLKELIMCGDTEILAPNLRIVINKLGRTKRGITGFEQQFQILEKLNLAALADDSFVNAKAQCNINKNRYLDKLPCEGLSRVVLRWNEEQGSDYINASYIDGYKQRRAYIATQGPLESTMNDFWRMVWEQKSRCIVMLCQLEENEKEMSSHYWPADHGEPEIYDKITVKKLSQVHVQRGDYIIRTFEIDSGKQLSSSCLSSINLKTAFSVTQFQLLAWPEHENPCDPSSLIELVEDVNKVQMKAHNRPIIVMCNDGVGRTGTFICIHAQLERLKTEGVVDFFQFVKSARIQRPQLILNTGQYELCHSTVLQYIQRCDNYANFKDVV